MREGYIVRISCEDGYLARSCKMGRLSSKILQDILRDYTFFRKILTRLLSTYDYGSYSNQFQQIDNVNFACF